MPSDAPAIKVEFTQEFKRNLRALAKKYRHIRTDLQPTLARLQAGEVIGDQVQRFDEYH
jgi:mRNA-degrading endonuclease RelE of RelBE toxin-antitoxin system